jgi:glucose/arabinose dehydrogenase
MVANTVLLSTLVASAAAAALAPMKCPEKITPKYTPVVAKGFTARVVANGVSSPRNMVVDSAGRLLVVEKGIGVTSYNIQDGDCVELTRKEVVVPHTGVRSWLFRYP